MKIKAKFKGKDGLGYKNGQEYTLRLDDDYDDGCYIQEIVSESHGGALIRLRDGSFCKYSSLRKFLDNWEVL